MRDINESVISRQVVFGGLTAIAVAVGTLFAFQMWENVDADEILVVQSPFDGTLTWYVDPGIKYQGFGKTTFYKKRSIYDFDDRGGDPTKCTKGITVRFNDGGHGVMCGSVQYELPLEEKLLTALHVRFGSQPTIQRQLVETVTSKAVYFSGPLMSSRESYAEKRNDLIRYVEDQIQNGVYQTSQKDIRVKDLITGQEKSLTAVEIVKDPKTGHPLRQEEGVLTQFGIKAFNFAVNRIPYDLDVEKQIKQQQEITMSVQTSIANAKQAEQDAITVAERGKADAATAKWKQETIKAKEVTEAEQRKQVAELDVQTAAARKKENILLGEGEGERKRLVMQADGALEKKLAAYIEVQKVWSGAIKDYKGNWVPGVVMGTAGHTQSGAQAMVDILTVKTAKDLALDMSLPGTHETAKKK